MGFASCFENNIERREFEPFDFTVNCAVSATVVEPARMTRMQAERSIVRVRLPMRYAPVELREALRRFCRGGHAA